MNEMELLTKMLATIPEDASPPRAEARVRGVIGSGRHREVGSRGATARRLLTVARPDRAARAAGAPARTGANRRVRLALAGGVAAAAIAGALLAQGLLPGGTTDGGTRPTGSAAQLAAWTVQRAPGGLLIVTIRDLRDPSGLAALLRRYGVPARLEFPGHDFTPTTSLSVLPRGCKSPDISNRAYSKLEMAIDPPPPVWMHLRMHYRKGTHGLIGYAEFRRPQGGLTGRGVFAVRPSAIPPGIGLFIEAWANPRAIPPGGSGDVSSLVSDLVAATPQCTGS
jgi:hypothetical protein